MGAILVTGAAGFVGSHVCETLLARGELVVGFDNFDPYYDPRFKRRNVDELQKHRNFAMVEADVRDSAALKNVASARQIDRIVHLAALAGVRASVNRANDYVAVNVGGTVNVLDAARSTHAKTVIISTSSVYGSSAPIPFVETDAADQPLAPYPASKRAAELMAHSYVNMFGLAVTAVRLFSVYGPRGRPDMMPYQIAKSIANGTPITLFNNGQMLRDWTYVSDIASGIVRALDKLGQPAMKVYNLGRGEPVLMADFVQILEELIGRNAVIKNETAPASEPPQTFADVRRARDELGYTAVVPVADGLAKFWEWFRLHSGEASAQ